MGTDPYFVGPCQDRALIFFFSSKNIYSRCILQGGWKKPTRFSFDSENSKSENCI